MAADNDVDDGTFTTALGVELISAVCCPTIAEVATSAKFVVISNDDDGVGGGDDDVVEVLNGSCEGKDVGESMTVLVDDDVLIVDVVVVAGITWFGLVSANSGGGWCWTIAILLVDDEVDDVDDDDIPTGNNADTD